MDSFTGVFQGFYLDFKNAVLTAPSCFPHVLSQAPPPPTPLNFQEPPYSQHLWETLNIEKGIAW